MPAESHFRAAAAELRRAALEKRHEVDMAKKQLTEHEQQARRTIQQLKNDQQAKEQQSGDPNIDSQHRAELQKQAKQDLAQTANVQRSLTQEKDLLRKHIAALEAEIHSLEQQASDFERRT